jgi:hypothetical protein
MFLVAPMPIGRQPSDSSRCHRLIAGWPNSWRLVPFDCEGGWTSSWQRLLDDH